MQWGIICLEAPPKTDSFLRLCHGKHLEHTIGRRIENPTFTTHTTHTCIVHCAFSTAIHFSMSHCTVCTPILMWQNYTVLICVPLYAPPCILSWTTHTTRPIGIPKHLLVSAVWCRLQTIHAHRVPWREYSSRSKYICVCIIHFRTVTQLEPKSPSVYTVQCTCRLCWLPICTHNADS